MLTGAVCVAGCKIHIPHAKPDIRVFATLSPDMRFCRYGTPFHNPPKYQNPCVSVHCIPIPPVFFNQTIWFDFIIRTQAKALPKSKERFPMSLTGPGIHYIFFSHPQLTFLQFHGRLCYENWPHSVNSGTEFSPVKIFPSLPCVQLCEVQHHFIICKAWRAQFHPDIIHGKEKSVT